MATITTYRDDSVPQTNRASRAISKAVPLPASGVGNGDNVQVTAIPVQTYYRLTGASLLVDATLGASATAKLQLNRAGVRTDLTAATTAGAASRATSASLTTVPVDLQPGDIIEILIGGAAVSSAANAFVDLTVHQR